MCRILLVLFFAIFTGFSADVFSSRISPSWHHAPSPQYDTSPSWHRVYLGIDGGYSMSLNSTNFTPIHNGLTSLPPLDNSTFQQEIGNSSMIGLFLGYHVNDSMRLEINYDYRNHFNWEISAPYLNTNDPPVYVNYLANNIQIQTLFMNIKFYPLVNWGQFTPYVNAGLGASFNQSGKVELSILNFFDAPANSAYIEGGSSTNFAWNVGVGMDYAIINQLHFTLGYRFVDAGVLRSGDFSKTIGVEGTAPIMPFKANQILLNEVIMGLMWTFDNPM